MVDDSPDFRIAFRRRHGEAIARVDDWVRTHSNGGRLSAHTTASYADGGFETGWRVGLPVAGALTEFHLLVDASFPYSATRVAVPSAPPAPAWPHLERHGLLCLLPTDGSVSSERPADVVADLLETACELVAECLRGGNVDEFRDEFLSYWELTQHPNAKQFVSLLEPEGPSRLVHAWYGRETIIVGEDAEALQRWLRRRRTPADSPPAISEAGLIWLPEPLLPTAYPNDAAALLELAETRGAGPVVRALINSSSRDITVLLGASSRNGVCYGATTVPLPQKAGRQRNLEELHRGFRPGRLPEDVLLRRRLSPSVRLRRAVVQRADHRWVHGRDRDDTQGDLRTKRVAVLGCGALGSACARLLAQAGVGNLLLVDPATLDWPNVSRHMLDARSVGLPKASEVARVLRQGFPHLGDIDDRVERVSPTGVSLMPILAASDLIVSTMGDWAAESFLSDVQRETVGFPTVVFGWMEPHAIAAHTVTIPQGSACLRCGTSDTGTPALEVGAWPNESQNHTEPACGASFAPYGPIGLSWAQTFVANAVLCALTIEGVDAIHRIWIASRDQLTASNGRWSSKWIAEVGDPGPGNAVVERGWPTTCSLCQSRMGTAEL